MSRSVPVAGCVAGCATAWGADSSSSVYSRNRRPRSQATLNKICRRATAKASSVWMRMDSASPAPRCNSNCRRSNAGVQSMPAQRKPSISARPTLRLSRTSAAIPVTTISASSGSPGSDFNVTLPRFRASAQTGMNNNGAQLNSLVFICLIASLSLHLSGAFGCTKASLILAAPQKSEMPNSCSAICTLFRAAPFLILSATTQKLMPRGWDRSSLMRPTNTESCPAASVTAVG